MSNLNLTDMLKAASKRMSNDLKERLISHPGELGADREEILRSFLQAYLPKRFEISNGFVFDSKGNLSQQLDIIIADSLVCPRFETFGGTRIYPCECVVAVGQVKSSITSTTKLHEALDNLRSVKSLDRSAGGNAIDSESDEVLDPLTNHLHQIFTFLFITDKSLLADSVSDELIDYVHNYEPHLWPNIIFALDHYLITFCCDNGVCPNPMDARGIAIQQVSEDQDILLRLYLLLGGAIEVTRVSGLPYWEYLHNINQWNAMVWHSSSEYPPPLLSSLKR